MSYYDEGQFEDYEKSDIHFCRTCCIGRFFLHKGNAYVHTQPLTRMRLLNKKRVLQIPPLGALRPQELPLVKLH